MFDRHLLPVIRSLFDAPARGLIARGITADQVSLAGFAKSAEEKAKAEQLARGVNGVRSVRNSLVIR